MAGNTKRSTSLSSKYAIHSVQLSLRWVQGYRYLDRCGECLVQLEKVLEDGWIPVQTSPTSGSMKNENIGMVLGFNSEGLDIRQSEFLDPEVFFDQSNKIYDTIRRILDIERITTPANRVFYQKGFGENEIEMAEQELRSMQLCTFRDGLLSALGGDLSAIGFTVVTSDTPQALERRRRLQASVIKQARQESLDSRILMRSRQLGSKQRDAIIAIQQLRKRHPELSPVAIQFEFEYSVDTEILTREFNMADFITESSAWAESAMKGLLGVSKV